MLLCGVSRHIGKQAPWADNSVFLNYYCSNKVEQIPRISFFLLLPRFSHPFLTSPDSALKTLYTFLHGIYIASTHRQLNDLTLELFSMTMSHISDFGLNYRGRL